MNTSLLRNVVTLSSRITQHLLLRISRSDIFITENMTNMALTDKQLLEKIMKHRITYQDFDMVHVISRGVYGEVQLTRHKTSGKMYAMKLLSKELMITDAGTVFYWTEREVLMKATSDWIVKLHYSFHDEKCLYLAMDYMGGGDMAVFLSRRNERRLTCCEARFYCAEIVLALDYVHSLGFVYGELEAENVMIAPTGHIKLVDFGSCMRMNKVRLGFHVGSPDYMAPETFMDSEERDGYYGRESDWWSLGVLLYEMLAGHLPFRAKTREKIYSNIGKRKERPLRVPEVIEDEEAESLIQALVSDRSVRLGKNGIDEIKSHPFFKTDKWTFDNIRHAKPPHIPKLIDDRDAHHFRGIAKHDSSHSCSEDYTGHHEPFIGFTYSKELNELLSAAGKRGSQNVYSKMFWGSQSTSVNKKGKKTVETFPNNPHPDPVTEAARFLSKMGWTRDNSKLATTDLLMVADMMAATKPEYKSCEVEVRRTVEEHAIAYQNEKIKKLEEEILKLNSAAAAASASVEYETRSRQEAITQLQEVTDRLNAAAAAASTSLIYEKSSKQQLRLQMEEVRDKLNAFTSENLERTENEKTTTDNVMQRVEEEMANAATFSSESAIEREALQEKITLLEKELEGKSKINAQKDEEIRALTDANEAFRQTPVKGSTFRKHKDRVLRVVLTGACILGFLACKLYSW